MQLQVSFCCVGTRGAINVNLSRIYTACSLRGLLGSPEIAMLLCTLDLVLSTLQQRNAQQRHLLW